MTIHVETRQVGLAFGLNQRRRPLEKRCVEHVRPRLDGSSYVKIAVQGFVFPGAGRRLQREQLHALAIHADFELARFGESLHALIAVSRQPELDFVLTVRRKRIACRSAAARAEGQLLKLVFLGQVGWNQDGFAEGSFHRRSHCQPADLARRTEISLEQGGRKLADGEVIEAVAGVVFRQHCRHVQLHCQQIADGVLVLGAIEAAEGIGPAGIRPGRGGAVQRGFEVRDQRVVGLRVGARHAGGRHVPDAQLAHHLFPDVGPLARIVRVERAEHESSGFPLVAMAAGAIPIDDGACRCGRLRLRLWTNYRCRGSGQQPADRPGAPASSHAGSPDLPHHRNLPLN